MPYAATDLLAWAWQRCEIEVAHREQKTGFGVGEPPLLGWGQGRAPTAPATRWWRGSGRWSLGQLWTGLRGEFWDAREYRPVWAGTGGDWWEMADWIDAQTNALLGSGRT